MIALTHAFGLSREPFAQDLPVKDSSHCQASRSSATASTTPSPPAWSLSLPARSARARAPLRAAASGPHPSQYRVLSLVATTGSFLELLRQICLLGDPPASNSCAKMLHMIRDSLSDITAKKQVPLLLIDEAHLMRLEVFAQLHTLTQMDFDSRPLCPWS